MNENKNNYRIFPCISREFLELFFKDKVCVCVWGGVDLYSGSLKECIIDPSSRRFFSLAIKKSPNRQK